MVIIFLSKASAKPLAIERPTLMPVNEPGPALTDTASIESRLILFSLHLFATSLTHSINLSGGLTLEFFSSPVLYPAHI
jgi:hypothetical protein